MSQQAAGLAPLEKMPTLLLAWRCVYLGLALALGIGLPLAVRASLHQAPPAALFLALPLFAILAWVLAGLRFRHYRAYLHAGEGVVVFDGIWWRKETWVPIACLQHIDVSQGPLDRRWGMATLSLHTAGAHHHETRIAGLPLAQAHALRAALLPSASASHAH